MIFFYLCSFVVNGISLPFSERVFDNGLQIDILVEGSIKRLLGAVHEFTLAPPL